MEIIDISPTLHENLAVFPGDTPFSRKIEKDIHHGDSYTLSSMTMSLHGGAHMDAPSHYHKEGKTIDEQPLEIYFGPCQVISVPQIANPPRIYPEDIAHVTIKAPRLLFHTGSFPHPNEWNDDFFALSPELIDYLAQQQIKLVGTDTPSIDPASSKPLESHQSVYESHMAVLEGIVLDHVPPGLYELVALPLKIKEGDASPVRAILIKN